MACVFHKHRDASQWLMVEGGGSVLVCQECHDRLMYKKYICKHCKVPVVSNTNTRAILGREHGKHCPRRNK